MSIYVASAYALTLAAEDDADYPIILWDNLVTADNVTADEEEAAYPVTNLANPSTVEVWKSGSTADQLVTVTFAATEVDAIGIARHNLGSGEVHVTVEGTSNGTDWFELVGEQIIPADDTTILFRWEPQTLLGVRLSLEPDAVEPQAAVLSVGKLLVFERGVQAHMPINYARQRDVRNVRSVSGDYLGRVIIGGTLRTTAEFKLLSAAWMRSTLDPFIEASGELPFFFAWSPERYPLEVGFVWLTSDVMPSAADLIGRVNLSLPLEGILT